jgi:hypothetical protein
MIMNYLPVNDAFSSPNVDDLLLNKARSGTKTETAGNTQDMYSTSECADEVKSDLLLWDPGGCDSCAKLLNVLESCGNRLSLLVNSCRCAAEGVPFSGI